MKYFIFLIVTFFVSTYSFAAEKAAIEDTTPPAASGPLSPSSVTIPVGALPPPQSTAPAATGAVQPGVNAN